MKKLIFYVVILIACGLAFAQPAPMRTVFFWQLLDTPSTYTDQGGKGLRVNSAADAIEFYTWNLTDFDYQTNWRIFYSDGSGDVTELALGSNGQHLKSNGASSAPTWATPGGGDLLADGTVPMTANWDIGNYDITLKSLTGDGTIEGATLTEGGNAVPNDTDKLSFFAATSSSELFGVLSNETGSGSGTPLAVFNQAPVIDGNIKNTPRHLIFNVFNPNAVQGDDTQVCLWPETDANLTVTKITVTLDAAGNEVAGDLKYADTFIGLANAVVINVFDTSSGVLEDDSITSGSVAAGKAIYIQFDSAPNAAITQMCIDVEFDYD